MSGFSFTPLSIPVAGSRRTITIGLASGSALGVSNVVGVAINAVTAVGAAVGSGSAAGVIQSGIAAPTVTNVSATGAVPLVLSITDGDYIAGNRLVWEFAASLTPAKNLDGSYTTPTQRDVTFIDGSSWASLDMALGYSTPSGPFSFHCLVFRDNEETGTSTFTDARSNTFTGDASAWSNDYTDTISVSSATWSPSTGSDKSQYLTLSNGNLTATMNNTVNANCGIKATFSVTGQRYFETTVVTHGTETNGSLGIGIVDAAVAVGSAVFPTPGGSGVAGAHFRLKQGSTAVTIFRNGGSATGTSLSTAVADGDKFGISFDTTANTVKLSHRPTSTGIWYDVQTLTLTSQIPTNWRAYVCHFGRTGAGAPYDASTTNFGATTFSRTLDSGYLMYG